MFDLFKPNEPRIGIIIGTGPSLTKDQLKTTQRLQEKGALVFGANNVWQIYSDLTAMISSNPEYYDHYWEKGLKDFKGDIWTWDAATAAKYDIKYVQGKWEPGLSRDPNFIHYHHGAGPQIVNIAYHYGVRLFLLVGWDMHYPGKQNDHHYTEKRHFFGEYPEELQHFPRTGPNGEFTGLIREMETINPDDYNIEIINCTEGSAMTCFPMGDIKDYL